MFCFSLNVETKTMLLTFHKASRCCQEPSVEVGKWTYKILVDSRFLKRFYTQWFAIVNLFGGFILFLLMINIFTGLVLLYYSYIYSFQAHCETCSLKYEIACCQLLIIQIAFPNMYCTLINLYYWVKDKFLIGCSKHM